MKRQTTLLSGVSLALTVLGLLSMTTSAFAFDPLFYARIDYGAGDYPVSVYAADLDGDGDDDLAVANLNSYNVSILKNNGDGSFASAVNYGTGGYPSSVYAADLDGDGDDDLAVANRYSYNVSILTNNGDGAFASAVNYGAGDNPTSVYAADLDGDGDADLAVANFYSYNVSILINLSNVGPPAFCTGFSGLFCDDFEDGVITDWQALAGSCAWTESNGSLSTSNTGTEQWCIQTVGNQSWADVEIEAKVKGNGGVDKVLLFRVQDEDNFYAVNLRSDYPTPGVDQVTFDKMVDGVYQADLVTAECPSENGVWYHLEVACADNSFKVYVDDALVLEYTDNDNPFYTGGIGVACWTGYYGECDISFDEVAVTEPFPEIEFTGASGESVGEPQTISGWVHMSDNTPYQPAYGEFGVEDPISKMSSIVDVSAAGDFSYTTNVAANWPNNYLFLFFLSTEYGVIKKSFVYPVSPIGDPVGQLSSHEVSLRIGPADPLDRATDAYAVRPPVSSLPAKEENIVDKGKAIWEDVKGVIATSWKRQKEEGFTSDVYTNVSFHKEKCAESGWWTGSCVLVVAGYAYMTVEMPIQLVFDYADEAGDLAFETDQFTACNYAQWELAVESAEWIKVFVSADLEGAAELASEAVDLISQSSNATEILQKYDDFYDECDIGERNEQAAIMLKHYTDQFEEYGFLMGMVKIIEDAVVIRGLSPITLQVTDPLGRIVNADTVEVPRASYARVDSDFDGVMEDIIIIPVDSIGGYQIEVIPDSTAQPSDSFSVTVDYTYFNGPMTLIDNMLIVDLPPDPYQVETFENLAPASFDLISPDEQVIADSSSPVFNWHATLDSNQEHTVYYDLLIAADSLFNDTVAIYSLTDTSVLFTDALPTDSLDNRFFWKVRAHDLWGASTFSDQTFSFYVGYICGDIDGNGNPTIDIADLVYLVDYMFQDGPEPPIMEAADIDGSGGPSPIDISDLVYLVDYMFTGGPAPTACP